MELDKLKSPLPAPGPGLDFRVCCKVMQEAWWDNDPKRFKIVVSMLATGKAALGDIKIKTWCSRSAIKCIVDPLIECGLVRAEQPAKARGRPITYYAHEVFNAVARVVFIDPEEQKRLGIQPRRGDRFTIKDQERLEFVKNHFNLVYLLRKEIQGHYVRKGRRLPIHGKRDIKNSLLIRVAKAIDKPKKKRITIPILCHHLRFVESDRQQIEDAIGTLKKLKIVYGGEKMGYKLNPKTKLVLEYVTS